MTQDKVVELVRKQLKHQHPGGATLEVVQEGMYQRDGYWYLPVRPSVQPPKMYEFYEALAEVESTLEENEQLGIWLVPLLAGEEVLAASDTTNPGLAVDEHKGEPVPKPVPSHVVIDDKGVARIDGLRTKVIQIAIDKIAQGWDADEIHKQYPYLSLGQIHSALSYYYDHQAELDAEIERRDKEVERMRAEAPRQPTRRELEERLARKSEGVTSD